MIATAAALLVFAFPEMNDTLMVHFDHSFWRAPWRWLTCHWVHWSVEHLTWDAATLAFVGWLAERRWRARLSVTLIAAAVVIPPVVKWTTPLDSYAGLSGLDVAIYALLATRLIIERWSNASRSLRIVIIAGVVGLSGKLGFEAVTGQLWFVSITDAAFVPVPVAHLVGAVVGVLCGVWTPPMPSRSIAGRIVLPTVHAKHPLAQPSATPLAGAHRRGIARRPLWVRRRQRQNHRLRMVRR